MPLGQKRELYCLVAMSILAQGQQQNPYVAFKLVKTLTLDFISYLIDLLSDFRYLNIWENVGGIELDNEYGSIKKLQSKSFIGFHIRDLNFFKKLKSMSNKLSLEKFLIK